MSDQEFDDIHVEKLKEIGVSKASLFSSRNESEPNMLNSSSGYHELHTK